MNIQAPDAHVFRFGIFELDTQSGELRRHGLKVRLPDQSFQILKTLIGRPGEMVTRDELRRVLWTEETFVDFERERPRSRPVGISARLASSRGTSRVMPPNFA